MTNISAINSKNTQIYSVTKNHGLPICDTLLPNGIPCYHHMEDRVVNCKEQKYFQLANK